MQNQAYTSLVRQILEYACCVWDPQQHKHIKQLESVQHHAARLTTGNYHSLNPGCVTNMVTQLGWDLLEHRRAKHRITMFYKIINFPVHHQLKVHDSSTCCSASHKFRQFSTKLNCYKYSFLPATIVSWNNLPLQVSQLWSIEQFQQALSQICVSSLLYQLFEIFFNIDYVYIEFFLYLKYHFGALSALEFQLSN